MIRLKTAQLAGGVALSLLLTGCGSEPSSGEGQQSPAVAATNQVAETLPAVLAVPEVTQTPTEPAAEPSLEPTLEPSLEPSLQPVAGTPSLEPEVSDPLSLEPSLDPGDPGETGGEGEESVEDILKQLNAIKLDDDPNATLGDPDKVVALMAEGNALVQAGDAAGALEKYREALEFADGEGDPDVFFNMGIAHKARGEMDQAITAYEKALKLAPEYSEAHNNLGNLLKDQKKYTEAITHYEASIKIFPDNPNTHNNLGTVYAMMKDVNKAAIYFAKAVRIQPTYFDARQNLGVAYMQQGRLDAAERELGEAVKMAMGGLAYEQQRLKAAQVRLAEASTPEERLTAQSEVSAAQKAGQIAGGKYHRGMSFLKHVRDQLGKPVQSQ